MSAWFYTRQGQTVGPVSWEHLRELFQRGELRPQDYVYQEGLGQWVAASSVAGLTGAAPAPPPPAPTAIAVQPARPVPQARPVQHVAPDPGPVASETAAGGNVFLQILLELPKPILFGLCGGAGGLVAALLLGELLWFLLHPAVVHQGPKVHLAVPSGMRVYVGGKNHFAVKVAREGFKGPIRVELANTPPGVHAAPVTIAPDQDEAEIVVDAAGPVPPGKHPLAIRARGPEGQKVAEAGGTLELNVEAPPPNLGLSVSPEVALNQGGKARFSIRVARASAVGPVSVQFTGAPPGVALPPLVVPAEKDAADVEVSAAAEAPTGRQAIAVEASGAAGTHARQTFQLQLLPAPAPKADVLFVLDLTGSMQFAINGIKDGIRRFADELERQRVDVRVGLIGFRDIEEVRERPFAVRFGRETFTTDYQAFRTSVGALRAQGGGDEPESSLQALGLAAQQPFRADAARVVVLITDAPPKYHPAEPPTTPQAAADLLRQKGITQIHLVTRSKDSGARGSYGPLRAPPFKGSFFEIGEAQTGDAFAELLPRLGEEISRITVASQPAPPESSTPPLPTGSVPDLPPANETPTLQAVQSMQAFAAADRGRLVLAIGIWTAAVAAGISLLILAGQHYYLRRSRLPLSAALPALGGGLLAGLIGGAAGQLFATIPWLGVISRVVGWSLLGALLGGGLAVFVPNLKWSRGLYGGLAGGLLGAIVFLLLSSSVGDVLGRWTGAAVLGFCIGLMVALAEIAFRRAWLEVTFGAREVRTVTLGAIPVSVGGDERRASVYVPGAAPIALRYRVEAGRVLCEDAQTGRTAEVEPGGSCRLGNATIKVCSPASARASGFRLVLSGGRSVHLTEGMPLTAEDLPGLEPQGTDGVVALVSRRPSDPKVLLLRNRSKQPWRIYQADGTPQTIPPGLGVELAADLHIDFGGPQGRVTRAGEAG